MLISYSPASLAEEADTAGRELIILNWSEYIDPELVSKFEQQYRAKIKEIYFESDDYRDNYMLETKGQGIDIVMVNGIKIDIYRRQNWITPLTEKEVPNLKHIDSKWLSMFEGTEGYVVPYFWGTIGIAYRKDLVKTPVTGWKHLYRPEESLRGKIAMIGASRDLIGMALKTLGYSVNSSSFEELEEAKQLLLQQKPYVRDYAYINLDETSALVSGEIAMAMAYSGDAMMVQEHNENIAYVVPEEGGELWVDYMVVTAASVNKQLAYHFLDFINQPEHAARLAEYVHYATPNKEAEKLLPAEFRSDPVIYPPGEVLDKSEIYKPLPPRVIRVRNEIFSRVTEMRD